MIHSAITQAAFDATVATLKHDSVALPRDTMGE
jgi:hypothetical protein